MGEPVEKLQSFGSLMHFRPENAPANATQRCTDNGGCPAVAECPFDARKIYLNMENNGWPVNVISTDTRLEARQKAFRHRSIPQHV
jgi:hypothetical protein